MTLTSTRRRSKQASTSDRQKTVDERASSRANLPARMSGSLTDIGERKRAQEALAETEGRYRMLFENMLDGFAYCQMLFEGNRPQDFIYLAVNTAFETLTGLQNVVGRRVTEVIPGIRESDPELFEIYGRVARTGQPERFEYWLKPLDAWLDICVYSAQEGYFVAVFDNITERKRAEQTLRTSESNYRTLIESAADGIFVTDAQGRIDDVNTMGCRMLGYTREEVLTSSIGDLIAAEEVARVAPTLTRVSAGEVMRNEWQARRKDGTLFPCEASATILPGGRTLGILRDITERRRTEESHTRLVTAVEQAAEAVMIADANATILYVNPAFEKITGYTREEAIGQNPRILKSGEQNAEFYRSMWATLTAGHVWSGHLTNKRKDGTLYEEDSTISPVRDAAGKIVNYVAVKRDVSEQQMLEAQFRQAQKMESVGELAGGIAHDFNNMLTVINGTAELALMQLRDGDPLHEDLQEIRRAGERAAALTRQLLAFSRKQILQPQVMNLNKVVAEMESMLRRLIGEDIDLVVVPTESLGNVKADPGQIEQVIVNLAVNARDAMPQGGKLTVELRNVEIDEHYARQHSVAVKPGPYVMLAMSDTGVGMDEVTRGRIFEPFFTTKDLGKGTGLGLSTVYGIVKQSDGFIWVDSEVGHGTSFKIYLPQMAEVAGGKRRSSTVAPAHGTETILIVEDVGGLRHLAKRMLESASYTVLTAADGEEALRLLARDEQPVHLMVTDVVMPGMSGRNLAELFDRTRPGMKVLYMSGYTDDVVVRHGVLDEGMPFLGKPFTGVELIRKVREVLDLES